MKILFLHLSDLHIEKQLDINVINVTKIVDALHSIDKFEKVIIIISGDIAFSGQKIQYESAWKMIGTIITKIKKDFAIEKIHVLVVPGNHDVDYSKGDLGHQGIQELFENGTIDQEISNEINKQKEYLYFSSSNYCLCKNKPLFFIKNIDYSDFIIQANLINSAIFSSKDEDKGLHYLTKNIIDEFKKTTDANFTITIMHHSHHWYKDNIKSLIEQALIKSNNLVFYGHEHNLQTYIENHGGYTVVFFAGGELCNRGNWEKSEFYTNILDSETKKLTSQQFIWNTKGLIYEKGKSINYFLEKTINKKMMFIPTEEFYNDFYEDEIFNLCKDFSKYFVFPSLQKQLSHKSVQPREIKDIKEFITEISKKKRIVLIGGEKSGKTVLLKQLFKEMSTEYACLFCDAKQITTKNCRKVIKRAFQDIYGDESVKYNKFEQLKKEQRVLFCDNAHLINKKYFSSFLEAMDGFFNCIIYTSKTVVELDVTARVKQCIDDMQFERYKILPFYSDKRYELIEKIVKIRIQDSVEQECITNKLADLLKIQRKLYSLDPCFIIKYTDYYCRNIGDATQNDGSIFSKVFEGNITSSISPFANRISVDKVMLLLDRLAYWLYKNTSCVINQEMIMNILTEYNEIYGDDVNIQEFMNIVLRSRLIINSEKNDDYRFVDKNCFAYFVAREIVRKWQDERMNDDILNLLKFACFEINSDIILFITYITDNLSLLNLILDKTLEYTSSWKEFELETVNIPYLEEMKGKIHIDAPTSKNKEEIAKKELQQEIEESENSLIIANDYFDYDEKDIEKVVNQITRALALLSIVSKSLPSFEHRMHKELKEKLINIIYQLPNKIFYLWANEVEKEKESLIKYFKKQYQTVYLEKGKEIKYEEINHYLQLESIFLLLEFMNIAMTNSMKINTEKYLNKFSYKEHLTYSLQHLMGIGKIDKVKDFMEESKRINNIINHVVPEIMEKKIIGNFMINSKKIQRPQIQQLKDAYFKKKPYKNILIDRGRIKKMQ